jgi:chitin-binding protein
MAEVETSTSRTGGIDELPRVTKSRVIRTGAVILFALVLGFLTIQVAAAHGSPEDPTGQALACYNEDPGDRSPMCEYAAEQNSQAIYNWMGIRDGDAAGNHQENIDDGELCSAGKERFAPYDEPGDWPSTEISPGEQTFTLDLSAPHATEYMRFYMTKDGWNPDTKLAWDDLELIHETGSFTPSGTEQIEGVDVPDRNNEEHVIYWVWQRSDSPEAFYSCSYVDVAGADDGGDTPPGDGDDGNDGGDGDSPSAWDSGTTYTSGDQVTHEGSTWEASWWTRGDEPGSSEWGPWEKVDDSGGDDGDDGSDGGDDSPDADAWDPDETYTGGDQVSHDGSTWEASWWTQGDEPGSSEWGPWEQVE